MEKRFSTIRESAGKCPFCDGQRWFCYYVGGKKVVKTFSTPYVDIEPPYGGSLCRPRLGVYVDECCFCGAIAS